jgi:hypothetical protein
MLNTFISIPKQVLTDGIEYNTLFTYDYIEGVWISSISVYQNRLINNSNHFIDLIVNDTDYKQETGNYNIKRKPTYIYSRIIKNYNNIISNQSNIENIIKIEDKCILLHNSFSTGNAGHDLFCILNTLMKYKNYKDLKYILFNEINNNNNIQIIKLFIDDTQIIKINEKKIYNLKKQIFNHEKSVHNPSLNYINIINEIKQKIINKCENELSKNELENLKNKKIIIIKNTTMNLIVRKEDCFEATILFNYLKENNWYICNPEKDNFIDMAYILLHASIIVTGDRGISCANHIFYNLNAKLIGFQINILDKDLFCIVNNNTNTNYDFMCNSLYHHLISKVILSPLIINTTHLEDIKKVFLQL